MFHLNGASSVGFLCSLSANFFSLIGCKLLFMPLHNYRSRTVLECFLWQHFLYVLFTKLHFLLHNSHARDSSFVAYIFNAFNMLRDASNDLFGDQVS